MTTTATTDRSPAMQIDRLSLLDAVELRFDGEDTERAIFMGITGEGDSRTARFQQTRDGGIYDWEAYRYNGRWAYGSSAGRLQLVSVA